MKRRHFLAAATAFALCAAGPLAAQTAEERAIAQLRQQGYERFRVSRTMLGRVRILATGPAGEREIVLNPGTGAVLRDHLERDRGRLDDDAANWRRGRGRSGEGERGEDAEDEDDDDKDDKDDDDDDDDKDDDKDDDDDGGEGGDDGDDD